MRQKNSNEIKEDGKRGELIVNTQGTCFLCLEETETTTSSEAANGESGLIDVCFRSICRYLQINQTKISSSAFNLKSESEEDPDELVFPLDDRKESGNCDLSVLLCPRCAPLTQELSTLIRQMEIIKLLMSQHLQTFHEILNESHVKEESAEASKQTSRWEKLEDKLMAAGSGWDSVAQARLVMQLRNETVVKCSDKVAYLLKTRVPKVCLERCDTAVIMNSGTSSSANNPVDLPHRQALGSGGSSRTMDVTVEQGHLNESESKQLPPKLVSKKYCKEANRPGGVACNLRDEIANCGGNLSDGSDTPVPIPRRLRLGRHRISSESQDSAAVHGRRRGSRVQQGATEVRKRLPPYSTKLSTNLTLTMHPKMNHSNLGPKSGTSHLRVRSQIGGSKNQLSETGDVSLGAPGYPPQHFGCRSCSASFACKNSLVKHQRVHQNELDKDKLNCNLCSLTFGSSISLRLHKHIHTGRYRCNLCQKNFRSKASLQDHQRTHTGEKPFPCGQCNKRFCTKGKLIMHQKGVHEREMRYSCAGCGRNFIWSQTLYNHLKKCNK